MATAAWTAACRSVSLASASSDGRRRLLREQDAEALLDGDALARELVVGREARRVRRRRGAARRVHLLERVDALALLEGGRRGEGEKAGAGEEAVDSRGATAAERRGAGAAEGQQRPQRGASRLVRPRPERAHARRRRPHNPKGAQVPPVSATHLAEGEHKVHAGRPAVLVAEASASPSPRGAVELRFVSTPKPDHFLSSMSRCA